MTPTDHERLSAIASIEDATADRNTYPIRGVALGEGDVTEGLSGKKTIWTAEALQDAAERLAGEQAKVLKGRPGEGHKPMDEQADPDEIIGAAIGRVIRSTEDLGTRILADERYAGGPWNDVREHLPPQEQAEFTPTSLDMLEYGLKSFWEGAGR